MPRAARNTKRGSSVLLRRKRQESKWRRAISEKAHNRALHLRPLAAHYSLDYTSLYRRWRRYLAAEAADDEQGMRAAQEVRRGGHNRAFTGEQEALLRDVNMLVCCMNLQTTIAFDLTCASLRRRARAAPDWHYTARVAPHGDDPSDRGLQHAEIRSECALYSVAAEPAPAAHRARWWRGA